jgi:hypothetical protein
MGSQLHVYVGPYLKVRPETVQVPEDRRACRKAGCRLELVMVEAGVNFCPECGTKTESVGETTAEDKVSLSDAEEAIREALQAVTIYGDDDSYYWIPNVTREGDTSINPSEDGVWPIGTADIIKLMIWFAGPTGFGPEIGALSALYGKGNCSLSWGVVAYWL